jgi:hypothetical protein
MAEPIIMVLVTSTITMTTSVLEVSIDIAGLVEVAVMEKQNSKDLIFIAITY